MIHQWFRQSAEPAPFLGTRISPFPLVHPFHHFAPFPPHPAPASLGCLKITRDPGIAEPLNVSDSTAHEDSARDTSSNPKFFATVESASDDAAKYEYGSEGF